MNIKILSKERLNSEITRFILKKPWDFQAGQYTILSCGNKLFYFSIASSPLADILELDIQNSPSHPLDPIFAKFLTETESLDLSPPAGDAVLRQNNRPLILIAGGSGIAPMKSIGQTAKIMMPGRPLHLYWGVRNRDCFYDLTDLAYLPVLSEEKVPGIRFGLVHEAVLGDFKDLSPFDIYLAGPFAMSFAAREVFLKHGAKMDAIFSDAFAFSN